jgi:Tfp pilus assembly protein PilF
MHNRLEQLLALYKEDPNDAFTRYAVALEYNARQDYGEALRWFEDLLRDAPDYVPTYYMLAGAYRATEAWDKAEQTYTTGIQVARKVGDAHAAAELAAALEELRDEREEG